MPATQFVPLEVNLIDEGRFLGKLDEALNKAQEHMIEHVKKFEARAKGAKSTISAKISLVCIEPQQQVFECKTAITITPAPDPTTATMVIAGESQTGEPRLICKKSGSSKDNPRQEKFLTEDGRKIDTKTGEITKK